MSAEIVVGVLADGTAHYAPVGEVALDGSRVICHLCGRSYRSVAAHLASHGWTKDRYCESFGLERGQSLESIETRKLRAAALTARLVFDPAMRAGSAAGRERAKAGELAKDAAAAARGRPFPEQRRNKAARARTASPTAVVAQANRQRADRHLAEVAESVARAHGFADLQAFVADRARAGVSLAAISREAGLHKDWLSRHLRRIDPEAAAWVAGAGAGAGAAAGGGAGAAAGGRAGAAAGVGGRAQARWLPVLRELGFEDLAGYLRCRHAEQHWTVNAMSRELGVSRQALEAALARHGLARVAHAAKRFAADQRAAQVAAGLGYASIAEYVSARRSKGLTWRALADESGQPQTWLRRHAEPGVGIGGSSD